MPNRYDDYTFRNSYACWQDLVRSKKPFNHAYNIKKISENACVSYITLQSVKLTFEEKVLLYTTLIKLNFPTRTNLDIEQEVRNKVFEDIIDKKMLRLNFILNDNPTESEWERLLEAMILDNDISNATKLVKKVKKPLPQNVKERLESLIILNKLK